MKLFGVKIDIWGMLVSCGVWTSLATLAGYGGDRHWFLDLLSHFRMQYLIFLVLLAAILPFRKKYIAAGVFALMAAVNFGAMRATLWTRPADAAAAGGGRTYRMLVLNVHMENHRYAAVEEYIRSQQPDFIILHEVDQHWLQGLSALDRDYPEAVRKPQTDNYGIALFSKLPLGKTELVYLGEGWVPSIRAEVRDNGSIFSLLAARAPPPRSLHSTRARNDLIYALPGAIKRLPKPVVIAGDLNISPWSDHYRNVLGLSDLRDSARGFGYQPTWPAPLPWWLRIPIDQFLHTPGIHVVARKIGPRPRLGPSSPRRRLHHRPRALTPAHSASFRAWKTCSVRYVRGFMNGHFPMLAAGMIFSALATAAETARQPDTGPGDRAGPAGQP